MAIVFATITTAVAAPGPAVTALERTVGRFLLGETPRGLSLMSETLGRAATAGDVDEFLITARRHAPEALAGLESRASRIERELQEIKAARRESVRPGNSPAVAMLSADERAILREISHSEVHLVPNGGQSLRTSEKQFLNGGLREEPALRIAETPAEQAPASIQARAKRGLREWRDDAQLCLNTMPTQSASSLQFRNIAEALAITTGVTTVGTVAQVGVAHIGDIDGGQFGIDLGMSLLSTLVAMKWVKHNDGFEVRWLKASTQSVARTPIDAELYRISPWTNTHGVPMEDAISERTHFNMTWTAKTSWISPLVGTILNGAECLVGQSGTASAVKNAQWLARGGFVIKTGVSAGNSIFYYKVRASSLKSAQATQ